MLLNHWTTRRIVSVVIPSIFESFETFSKHLYLIGLYNANNRLIKQFFQQYPKKPHVTLSLKKETKTKKIQKGDKRKASEQRYKQAQTKLLETIKGNFEQIKISKQQKTMLSEQVFKYCESKLHEMYYDKKNGGGVSMDQHRKKPTILDSII